MLKLRVCLVLLIAVTFSFRFAAQTKNTESQELLHKLTRHSSMPSGDFQTSPESASSQMNRQLRESKWKPVSRFNVSDPGKSESVKFAFDDTIRVLAPGEKPDPDGLPVSCNAIVIGTVTGAKSFVTQDRTNVYSDYQVSVAQTLKQDSLQPISPAQQIVVYRTGGSIHFPTGHVAHYVIAGKGFPEVGGQYVFFLTRSDPEIREYELTTGYQLIDGVVDPLDGPGDSPGWFNGMKIGDFLAKLQQAIAGGR